MDSVVARSERARGRGFPGELAFCVAAGTVLVALGEWMPSFPWPIVALLAGALVGRSRVLSDGSASFAATHLLRAGIVLLGLRLSLSDLGRVGSEAAIIIVPCVVVAVGVTLWLARRSGLGGRLSVLVAAGTAICGNTAILTVGPTIRASNDEIARAVATVTVFGTISMVVLPLVANWVGLSSTDLGMWAGSAINDTSQVVASAYSFSDPAGDVATIVKLARNLLIIPVAIAAALWARPSGRANVARTALSALPWFVVGLIAMTVVATTVDLPAGVGTTASLIARGLILSALAGVGMSAATLRMDRALLVPLAVGSAGGIATVLLSFVLIRITA